MQSGMRPIFAENILSPAAKNIFLYKAKIQGAEAYVTTQIMQDVGHGNFSLRAKVEGKDEIGYLAERFNHMLDNLENEKLLKRQAELHALQYQIRPHLQIVKMNSGLWRKKFPR